jgi:hypothetical protein
VPGGQLGLCSWANLPCHGLQRRVRLGVLPGERFYLGTCGAVRGGLLLPGLLHAHHAGGVPRGLLLPRGNGVGNGKPLPPGLFFIWRRRVHCASILCGVHRGLLRSSRQRHDDVQSLPRRLRVRGRHSRGGPMPRGLLLPRRLGYGAALRRGQVLFGWRALQLLIFLPRMRHGVLPRHGQRVFHGKSMQGGLRMLASNNEHHAGGMPRGQLLPGGLRRGRAVRGGHL